MIPFEPGKIYNRVKEIQEPFGGQRQGGISTPKDQPYVFIFTGDTGVRYGYKDDFMPDGTFWYTGEGQIGNMKMDRGNLAIQNHRKNKKNLILFEYISRGKVRCIGEAAYLGHHIERRPDENANLREAIIFELEINSRLSAPEATEPETEHPGEATLRLWSRPIAEVRDMASRKASSSVSEKTRRIITRQRSEAVKVYVLRRANGICESCNMIAPFLTKIGRPYLEPHHIYRLSDGGPDSPDSVSAVCPNCHKEIHYGINGKSLNERLIHRIKDREK
jgi:5-methylcytosine-specific restriction protein A